MERKSTDGQDKTLGMQVTKITLKDMVNVVDMDLATTTTARNGASTAPFVVCSKDAVSYTHLDVYKRQEKIRFNYREGKEKYTAEEWITDKYALNKSQTKLVRGLAKWRRKTVDLSLIHI